MRNFTVAQVRDRVRELIDAEQMRALGDTEMTKRISAAYAKYYCKLVKAGLGYPNETTQTIISTGNDSYSLPADHFATLRVDWQYSPNWWIPLEEIDIREIHQVQFTNASQSFWYRLSGQTIILYPTPAANGSYRHIYAPAPADLTTDSQTIDGVAGWEEAVILEVAIRCAMKWEGEVTGLLEERAQVDARIDEEAEMRSLHTTRHIVLKRREPRAEQWQFDPADLPPWTR